MNKQQTLQMLVVLAQGFSKKLETGTIEQYVEALASDRLTEEQAQQAVRHILRDEDRFPSIAKIRSYLRMYNPPAKRALDTNVRPAAEDGIRMARASKVASKLSATGYGVRWITDTGLEEICEPDEGFTYINVDWRDDELLENLVTLAGL